MHIFYRYKCGQTYLVLDIILYLKRVQEEQNIRGLVIFDETVLKMHFHSIREKL